MHPARAFHCDDPEVLLAQLARQPFATIAAAPEGRPLIAHTPVIARQLPSGLALDFHVSRGNALAPFVAEGFVAVAVSLGPDAYVSPDWYEAADQVPAWNYVSVEVEGPVAQLDDAGLFAILDDLSAQEEGRLLPKPPWTRRKMTPGRFEAIARAVVGCRLSVQRLEGTFKLSQNKSQADRDGVVRALGDHPMAAHMMGRVDPD